MWIVFVILLVYIPLMIGLYHLAVRYGRSDEAAGYVIGSLFVSPIVLIVVLWCIGETDKKHKERILEEERLKIRVNSYRLLEDEDVKQNAETLVNKEISGDYVRNLHSQYGLE